MVMKTHSPRVPQDKDALIKKLRAAVKAAEDRPSSSAAASPVREQPAEIGQRAQIRSLSLKVTTLERQASQLRAERERALKGAGMSTDNTSGRYLIPVPETDASDSSVATVAEPYKDKQNAIPETAPERCEQEVSVQVSEHDMQEPEVRSDLRK